MPRYVLERRINGKKIYRVYDTDKSMFICNTPKGTLYKKKSYLEFWLYHPKKNKKIDEDITRELSWEDARKLTLEYGSRDIYNKLFTVWKKSTNSRTGPHGTINLDDRTRTMALRCAYKLHMSLAEFVRMLIQKWDDYH